MCSLTSRLRFVAAFTWFYGYSSMKRGLYFVLSYLSFPLSLLFFIYVISHGQDLDYGLLGGLLGIMSGNSLTSIGDFVFLRAQLKIQDLLVASDVRPEDYVMALAAGNLVYSSPGLLLYLVLGFLLGLFNLQNVWLFLVLMLGLALTSTSLAVLVASRISHVRNVWGISSLLSVVLTLLPPLYYPYWVLPKFALYILMVSPSTPVSVLCQWYFGLGGFSFLSLVVFVIEIIVYPLLGLKLIRWMDKRTTRAE